MSKNKSTILFDTKNELESQFSLMQVRKLELDEKYGIEENEKGETKLTKNDRDVDDICAEDILVYCEYYALKCNVYEIRNVYRSQKSLESSVGKSSSITNYMSKEIDFQKHRIKSRNKVKKSLMPMRLKFKEMMQDVTTQKNRVFILDYIKLEETYNFLSKSIDNFESCKKECSDIRMEKIGKKAKIASSFLLVCFIISMFF